MRHPQLVTLALGVFALSVLAHERALQPSDSVTRTVVPTSSSSSAMLASMAKFHSGVMTRSEIALLRESLNIIAGARGANIEDRRNALQMLAELDEKEKNSLTDGDLAWALKNLEATSSNTNTDSNTKSTTSPSFTRKAGLDVKPGVPTTNHLGQTLVFSDEFDSLNMSTWSHEVTMGGGGNWEFEYYTNNRTNSYTKNGVLYLRPTLTADVIGEAAVVNGHTQELWGDFNSVTSCTDNSFYGCSRMSNGVNIINPIQSAAIKTINSFSFKYGNLQIRAKLPKGDWIWPAIWLLPKDETYGKWPASGEIDLVESRGNANGYPQGVDSFGSTLHYGPFYPLDPWSTAHGEYTLPSGDFSTDFHTFGLTWTPTTISTYIDDPANVVLHLDMSSQSFWQLGDFPSTCANPWNATNPSPTPNNMAPFDQEFFIKFNVAVGGTNTYFPDGVGNKPWTNNSPTAALDFWNARGAWYPTWQGENAAMQIDWIRVYQ